MTRPPFVVLAALALGSCSKSSQLTEQPPGSATASQPGAAAAFSLGQGNPVTAGRIYRIGDLSVTVVRIAMSSGEDEKGRELHAIEMQLRVTDRAGASKDLELVGDQAGDAMGLVFHADALGFEWGKSPASATLRADRK